MRILPPLHHSLAAVGLAFWSLLAIVPTALAQVIAVQEFRPFVIGVQAVARNGAVGGISIDAAGVVGRADEDAAGRLRQAWQAALNESPDAATLNDPIMRASPLRKISLRRLERALGELARHELPLTPDLRFLAGLSQVRFVFVYPDQSDIVLAGPADGWRVDGQGNIVGQAAGLPVLHLEDLLVSLAAADAHPGDTLRCSIDPSPAGLLRVQKLARSRRLSADQSALTLLEETLGPQAVTIAGVPADSRFARVMLAADYRMKRLAMGFDESPIDGLPSYLDILSAAPGSSPKMATPRWWLATRYQPLLRDADGLAWELRGPGVECRTEEHRLDAAGSARQTGQAGPAAIRWAKNMTDHYAELGTRAPIFAELQGVMDLAVVAALLGDQGLYDRGGWSLPMLRDPAAIQLSEFHVPASVPSLANLTRARQATVVSVSGGVEIDPWAVLQSIEEAPELSAARQQSVPRASQRWWWD
ncbi:MAG: DUF1598 domain-containing protein [Pirellulales bacterium]